jgi:anti-sigma factor RsiW
MQTHLTEDELVLHYYGEMSADEERRAAAHLQDCRECHAELRTLQRVLAVVEERAVSDIELPAHFERTVWARLEPNLRPDRPTLLSWLVLSPARLAWAAVVLVLVTAAFVAGRLSPGSVAPAGETTATAAQLRERVLLIDLAEHLDRSETMLVELASAGSDEGIDLSRERARAGQLVADNRLYRQTAAASGDAARQWTRLSGSPNWYGRTPAMRVGSSKRRWVMRTSPIGRREARS